MILLIESFVFSSQLELSSGQNRKTIFHFIDFEIFFYFFLSFNVLTIKTKKTSSKIFLFKFFNLLHGKGGDSVDFLNRFFM